MCLLGEGLNFIIVLESIRAVVQSLVMGAALFRQRSQENFQSLYSFFSRILLEYLRQGPDRPDRSDSIS